MERPADGDVAVSVCNHRVSIRAVLRRIVTEGRECGDFEHTAPLDDVLTALGLAAVPFAHPLLLQQRGLKELRADAAVVTAMVLRSLAP